MSVAKNIPRALLLNRKAIRELKDDKNALLPGLLFVMLFIVETLLLAQGTASPYNLAALSLFSLSYWLVIVSIAGFIPMMFGGRARYVEYLRVFNYSSIPFAIGHSSVVGIFGNLWGVVYLVYTTKEVFSLSWNRVVNGTVMLAVVCFFVYTILVPYLIKPYGSVWLSGMTLLSQPEKEGLDDFKFWSISSSYRIPENVYARVDTMGQKQCINDMIRDYSLNELQKHSFLITSTQRETKIHNIAVSKSRKACCVYAEYLGKTLRPGGGSVGTGFIQVDAVCGSEGMMKGGAYDLKVSVLYETTENGKTSARTDIGHVKGPNPIF